MSACICGHDDIYGKRGERREKHELVWLCPHCRRRMLGLPDVRPEPRHPLDFLPLVKVTAAALVLISAILAIGAHW